MPAISALICCANAADTLPAAMASVAFADELVIVDSGSHDATEALAREHADVYLQEPWRGYTGQKQFGTTRCRHPWVFTLDADEEVSPELANEIRALSERVYEATDVFSMPRRNWLFGKPVRSWWPDRQTRLFHRDRTTWPDEPLHDARIPSAPDRLRTLDHPLEHKRQSAHTWSDYFGGGRLDARLPLVARHQHARGQRARVADLILRPRVAFLKSYVLKAGFRDGVQGLLIAQKASVSTQLKYAALWAAQHGHLPPPPPPPTSPPPSPSPRPTPPDPDSAPL